MTWEMTDKELEAVRDLPGPKRYLYTVKKVADFEEVWSLWSENAWVLASDDAGCELVPIWPHPRLAVACATEMWSGVSPSKPPGSISLGQRGLPTTGASIFGRV